jgi:hypothetical protein
VTDGDVAQWQWVGGTIAEPEPGTYSADSNFPGSRYGACGFISQPVTDGTVGTKSWTVVVFGGTGCGDTCAGGEFPLDDLWIANISVNVRRCVRLCGCASLALRLPQYSYEYSTARDARSAWGVWLGQGRAGAQSVVCVAVGLLRRPRSWSAWSVVLPLPWS